MEENREESGEKQKKMKKVADLPYCTRAPSAEHMRAHEEDEPCDDGRSGNVDQDDNA
jgi:hypothetical protein